MQAFIINAVATAVIDINCSNISLGSFDSLEDSELEEESENDRRRFNAEIKFKRWNIDNVRFYDLLYEDKFIEFIALIEHTNKKIYFRNIYLFIKRVKNLATIKSDKIIYNNL